MNWLDIVLLVLLGLSAFQGLMRGLIKTVFSIIGVIVAIMVASRFYDTVSGWFGFADNAVFNAFSFVIILVAIMVAFSLLANMLRSFTSAILLGWVDRLGGALLGLLIGALLLGAALSVWVTLFSPAIAAESPVAGFLAGKFPLVLALLPSDFNSVRDFFTRLFY